MNKRFHHEQKIKLYFHSFLIYCVQSQPWTLLLDKIESILKQCMMFARKMYPSTSNNYKIISYDKRLSALDLLWLGRRRINRGINEKQFIYSTKIFGKQKNFIFFNLVQYFFDTKYIVFVLKIFAALKFYTSTCTNPLIEIRNFSETIWCTHSASVKNYSQKN